ncbi:MAG: hypothetical protein MJ145_00220 [Clostridia bacterium]|nr:hypothetical protein [Clostridia bacterium]
MRFRESIYKYLVGDKEQFRKEGKRFFRREGEELYEKYEKKNYKNAKFLCLILLVLMALILLKGILPGSNVYYNQDGSLAALERSDERYKLKVVIGDDSKDTELQFVQEDDEESSNNILKDDDYYLRRLVSDIESNEGSQVRLPNQLENGKRITWYEQKDNSAFLVFAVFLLVLVFLYKSRFADLKKYKKKSEQELVRALPNFLNMLILIWKSGNSFEDATKKAIKSLEKGDDYFSRNMTSCLENVNQLGGNIIAEINNFALDTNIKDFTRITNIMVENQFKGAFLLDKIEAERELMWMKRKKDAEEEGKKAETKLVIPMAMLLLVLILVTAMPAFMGN